MSEQQTNNNSGLYGIIIGILLLLSGGLGYFLWQKNQTMLIEKEKQATEVKNLNLEKERISKSLDSLSNAYAGLRTENESLTSKIASTVKIWLKKASCQAFDASPRSEKALSRSSKDKPAKISGA